MRPNCMRPESKSRMTLAEDPGSRVRESYEQMSRICNFPTTCTTVPTLPIAVTIAQVSLDICHVKEAYRQFKGIILANMFPFSHWLPKNQMPFPALHYRLVILATY